MARKSSAPRKGTASEASRLGPDRALAFLARLAAEFRAVLNLPDLLDHVMRVLHEEVGFDSCSVALLDDHNPDVLIIRAASGLLARYRGLAVPRARGTYGTVLETGVPQLIPDTAADPQGLFQDTRIRSSIYAPMAVQRHPIGVISAQRSTVGGFTEAELNVLTVVARYLAGAIEVAQLHEQVQKLAATDSLTGLANRRYFSDRLATELARSRRTGRALSVVLLDLNDFKTINDTHGHAMGDQVLIRVAEALVRHLRTSDLVARFGGDEFILMLPETVPGEAEAILSRVSAIELPDPAQHGGTLRLTCSWGSAAYPQDGEDAERLLQVADRRLYEMKQSSHGTPAQPPAGPHR